MLQAMIFDSYFDKHRGVIAYLRLFNGSIKAGDTIYFIATQTKAVVQEIGYFKPQMVPANSLETGEVGYLITGMKELNLVKVGDTVSNSNDFSNALPGYKEVAPKVYSSIFPVDAGDYPKLRDSMDKLKLNDASLRTQTEHIPALGYGFRCGFLGLLHMDIVQERLSREFDLDLVLTTPSVEYEVVGNDEVVFSIHTPSQLPDPSQINEIREPWIKLDIITPEEHIGKIIDIITKRRGNYNLISPLSAGQMQVSAEMPLAEMIVDLYDELKSSTQGYATLSYEIIGFRAGDLVKIDMLVNRNVVDPLSIITHRSIAEQKGREICEKLTELIPRQQFEIVIQAAIGARIIARETIKPFRKDVTEKLYGGDMTRRKKLLERQKKGKKKMKMIGNVEIPQSAFLNVLKK